MKLPELSPSQERRGAWAKQRHSRGDSSGQRRMIKVLLLRLAFSLQAETVPVTRALWCLVKAASQPGGQFRPAPNDQGTFALIVRPLQAETVPVLRQKTAPLMVYSQNL